MTLEEILQERKLKTLTVAQLREALADWPDDALVLTEGCDCIGEASAVIAHDDNAVLIERLP